MRHRRALCSLSLVAASCATAASPRSLPAASASHGELEAATREIYEAIPVGDRAVWERWLAEDFVLLDRDGKTLDRATVLADFKPLPAGIEVRLAREEMIVRELGRDAALVAFLVRETETIFGQTLRVDYRTALTFARRRGAWKLIAFQYVELPKDAEPADLDPEQLIAYVGNYAADAATRYEVTLRDGRLRGRRVGGAEVELVPEGDGVFYVPGTEFRKIFVRDRRGEVVEMLDRRKGTDVRWRRIATGG